MGRPWWYDSYWERDEKRWRRGPGPNRKSWAGLALVVLSLVFTVFSTRFQPILIAWIAGFVNYFCRILAFAIFVRALLSWFAVDHYRWPLIILNDLTEPILIRLRRVILLLGGFDFSPPVAILILNFIPTLFRWFILLIF